MPNLQIPFGSKLVGQISFAGQDDTSTTRGLTNTTVTISDSTNAYIADAGLGNNTVFIVPRQNVGGTPLTAPVTVTLTVNGKDPVLGGSLPPIAVGCDLGVEPPPPAHSTHIVVQVQNTVVLATVPPDPGTTTISLT
jgi:hypothetical protein